MNGFASEWLQLREPADATSRSAPLLALLSQHICRRGGRQIVDLGAGTGANLRYMAPRLGGEQHWLLLDHDTELLALLPGCLREWSARTKFVLEERGEMMVIHGPDLECHVRVSVLDLSRGLDGCELGEQSLVTASALLDLVSENWLHDLAADCRAKEAAVHFALTYDGRMEIHPPLSGDQLVRELVNDHQLGDKGFGAALGPRAVAVAKQIFGELGYELRSTPSDWCLGPREQPLQARLTDGWLQAATEMAPEETRSLKRWHKQRRQLLDEAGSKIQVGHQDLVGWLP